MDLIWNIMDLNSCYQLKMLFLVQRGLVGGNTKLTVSVCDNGWYNLSAQLRHELMGL